MGGPSSEAAASPLPLTVVTGLLGSGKTTLLSALLRAHRSPDSPRLLLIQNEFSEKMQIEAPALVDAAEAASSRESVPGGSSLKFSTSRAEAEAPLPELIELPNGCLCCVVRSELLSALEKVVSLLEERRERVDSLLLEVNGVSDPEKIIQGLWTDGQLHSRLRLDGVLVTVDASNPPSAVIGCREEDAGEQKEPQRPSLATDEFLGDTALRQIALADRVLLTKADLCSNERLANLRRRLETLNPTAAVAECVCGQVDTSFVLNLHAYDSDARPAASAGGERSFPCGGKGAFWLERLAENCSSFCVHSDSPQGKHASCARCEGGVGGIQSVFVELPIGDAKNKGASSESGRRLVSVQRLQREVAELLWTEDGAGEGGVCFRCKGLFVGWTDCEVEGDEALASEELGPWGVYLLQGVASTFEVRRPSKTCLAEAQARAALAEGGSGELKAKFLFVGRGLNREAITRRLESCITHKPSTLHS